MRTVLSFEPDGTIGALYTEDIRLSDLGRIRSVRRITNIEFNPDDQIWEVRWAAGPPDLLFAHSSRTACLTWEADNQERLYEEGEERWPQS